MHILLVDDNGEIRSTLTTFLQSAGHRVQACSNARDAWSRVEADEGPFELLITDIRMPLMGGMELATRLRARGSRMPIIFIAGGIEAELERPNMRFSPYRVLNKPFMVDTFLDMVREVGATPASTRDDWPALGC